MQIKPFGLWDQVSWYMGFATCMVQRKHILLSVVDGSIRCSWNFKHNVLSAAILAYWLSCVQLLASALKCSLAHCSAFCWVKMAAALTPEFKKAFQAALDDTGVTANMKKKVLLDMLAEQHITYVLHSAPCSQFLVHKYNRSGLGLDRFNVHKVGSKILSIGADMSKLDSAIAIEMAPSGPELDENLNFNKFLIKKSEGMLAPLTGAEKYLTVGCGHTAAFCKTAALCGPTPEPSLADDCGFIDKTKLGKDPTLMAMVEKGWDWLIVPWYIDSTFPSFAHHMQVALNSSNHVANLVSELEAATSISVFCRTKA